MKDIPEWHELIDRHLRGELSQAEKERLAELLDSDPAARKNFVEQAQWDTRMAEALRESDQGGGSVLELPDDRIDPELAKRRTRLPVGKTLLAMAASVILTLIASYLLLRSDTEPQIAKITGLSGALQWTGNGGRVVRDLTIGTELSGGTIEGMVPDSWFELKFNDGSTVAISGNSVLTFSDNGQKKLHLKEGNVSGNVRPQPAGRPMLIHTRSAALEVLGTQFEVEAGLAATTLNVSKGAVRIKRLSDGTTVDVPAKHRLIAATDREMLPVPIPASVNSWRSQLQRGPVGTLGKWSPPAGERGASLSTVPYTTEQGRTIFALGFGVSTGDRSPVILDPGVRLGVRGRVGSSHPVFFGVTVRRENGEFAGKFQTIRPATEFTAGQTFEALLDLRDFRLDPSLKAWKDKLPGAPFHLVVESTWCHTLDKQAGLEVTEIELIPLVEEK